MCIKERLPSPLPGLPIKPPRLLVRTNFVGNRVGGGEGSELSSSRTFYSRIPLCAFRFLLQNIGKIMQTLFPLLPVPVDFPPLFSRVPVPLFPSPLFSHYVYIQKSGIHANFYYYADTVMGSYQQASLAVCLSLTQNEAD